MADSKQAPATKEDVQGIMEYLVRNDGRTSDLEKRMNVLEQKMEKGFEETKQHFDVVAENIHYDMLKGALNDKVEQHEDRIVRLEQRAGLAAA